jgi:NADH-quinone oxidoreductase subunit G
MSLEMKPITIIIDGTPCTVDGEGKNLLAVCLSLGFDLPYFCWHPVMHSVGACRQCAVKLFQDANDTKGRIAMSCMTLVRDGMRVSIEDPEARACRGQITEWLMVNHPHDCPICDEGGECHLQDMVVMTGHACRRYRFTKRTHRNQDLGPFLNHEMNRCIQCYRCIRFYRDHAGGRDLAVLGWHDELYFGRHSDGPLENEFSGNLVEVCPTGVFTDKTLKAHYTRKWDLQTAPSVCAHCAVGCNTIPGERSGTLRRIRTRYNGEVNGYFLCDRGRYGYEFVNGAGRIRTPLLRSNGAVAVATEEEALGRVSSMLAEGPAIGIGSPRASVETNFALRDLVGPERFFMGIADSRAEIAALMVRILREGPAASSSLRQAGEADAVFVLGEDPWNTAPLLGLTLRQAAMNVPIAAAMKEKRISRWEDAALREVIRHQKGPFFVAAAGATALDEVAMETYRAAPADLARLGFAVAHEIDADAPAVPGLDPGTGERAGRIARALRAAERPLVVSGGSLGAADIPRAAANVARALKKTGRDARISLVFQDANSLGGALLASGGIESAARALQGAGAGTLIVAEADLFRHVDAAAARALLAHAAHVVAIDHVATATTDAAEVVLPAGTFAESSGTLVSAEGRAQRFFAVIPPAEPVRESWRWIGKLARATGRRPRGWESLDAIVTAAEEEVPELRGIRGAAPLSDFRVNLQRVPRKTHRESGRTAVAANVDLREPQPPIDADSALAWTMDARIGQPPAGLVPRYWAPGWNSDQSLHKFQSEVAGPMRGGDAGVRLIEPGPTGSAGYFASVPAAFARAGESLLLVPRCHVFGSEELSVLSPGIRERTPAPSVAVGREDAARMGLREGGRARLALENGVTLEMAVTFAELPAGVAAVPVGLPGVPPLELPCLARAGGAQ